jgi:ABC-type sugar transport system substrate-binding protein
LDRRLESLSLTAAGAPVTSRRAFITGLGCAAVATPLVTAAQPATPVKIGWLTTGPHPYFDDFRDGLKDLAAELLRSDRILKGPNALGLTLPQSFLIRADEIIR